jgi:NAD(P)-dependent dehydrogenase (short-subunit alcohol dehydrogenase family)
MMTQLFAARLAPHGINVYEIRPGIIETDMTGPVKAKYDDLIFQQGPHAHRKMGHARRRRPCRRRDRHRPAPLQHR